MGHYTALARVNGAEPAATTAGSSSEDDARGASPNDSDDAEAAATGSRWFWFDDEAVLNACTSPRTLQLACQRMSRPTHMSRGVVCAVLLQRPETW